MINSGQRSSLKLDRQNTKHRLCSPPPPSPPPPIYSIVGRRLSHQVVATAFVESSLPPLSPSSRRHRRSCCHHRAIATDTAVESPPPPSSHRHHHQAAVPVELPTDGMVYYLPGGIICLDSSDSSIGSDVEEIVKWDDCLRKTKTFSTAYLISLSLINSSMASVFRRFLRHDWSCKVKWISVCATATAVLIKDIAWSDIFKMGNCAP